MCFPRSLVEKSHGCCNDLNVLRARKYFPKVYWIHLTRHPITNILSQIECSDGIPRSMMNVNFLVKGESNSDWRRQGVKSLKFLKFHYRKSKDWLPVDIDEILLPDELEDEEYIMDQISGIEDESDYDSDDDTPNVENDYGLYNADDEDLLGKADEDIDEKELAEVLDGEDLEITVSQIVNTTMIKYNMLGDAYSHDETVCGMNDIRWSKTAGDYMMMQRKMNAKYNRSDEWGRTYYEW